MAKRKQYPLRIDPDVWEAIERWAQDEMRSANGQIEYLLRQALKKAGRLPKAGNNNGDKSAYGDKSDQNSPSPTS